MKQLNTDSPIIKEFLEEVHRSLYFNSLDDKEAAKVIAKGYKLGLFNDNVSSKPCWSTIDEKIAQEQNKGY